VVDEHDTGGGGTAFGGGAAVAEVLVVGGGTAFELGRNSGGAGIVAVAAAVFARRPLT
jgi:hypothetical protein